MIVIKKGVTGKKIIFTAYEQSVLDDPYYLFVFTNQLTKDVVKLNRKSLSTSDQKVRFDYISIDVNTFFETADTGYWTYQIYEQLSSTNTDPTGLNKVEDGLMKLNKETITEPIYYTGNSNKAKTYGE